MREHEKKKPADTYRIAILGDSFAEAKQVEIQDTFWSILQNVLQQCPRFKNRRVEAINFGVSGYGTAEELLTLRHYVWSYDPDLVILAFYSGNDVWENSRALNNNSLSPYFIYRNDQLILDNSYLKSAEYLSRRTWAARIGYQLIEYSRILQLANRLKNVVLTKRKPRAVKKQNEQTCQGCEVAIKNEIYSPPRDEVWSDAWHVTEGLIVLMREEVRQRKSQFLLVTLSTAIQAYPDEDYRKKFMDSLGINDLFYPDERLKALAEKEHIPILNLAPYFQTYAQKK